MITAIEEKAPPAPKEKRPDFQNHLVFEKWEVAYILSVSERTLEEMISKKEFPKGVTTSTNSRPRWHKDTILEAAARLYKQRAA